MHATELGPVSRHVVLAGAQLYRLYDTPYGLAQQVSVRQGAGLALVTACQSAQEA